MPESSPAVVAGETTTVPIAVSIVGVQKSATSTLHRMLVKHRHVAKGPVKEWHYFDQETRDWSATHDPGYVIHGARPNARFGVDSTPIYLFWPHALERMRTYNPEMKLIASFRDPIERAFSQWSMERGRDAAFPDFSESLVHPRFTSLPDAVPDGMSSGEFRTRTLVARGFYGQQLRRGYDLFPREQWLTLEFRAFLSAPESSLDRVTDFLDLPRFRKYPQLVQPNPSPRSHTGAPPTAADVADLAELYADDLVEFRTLSDIDVSGWPTARIIAGELDPADVAAKLARKAGLAT